jgi:hypothetical protein
VKLTRHRYRVALECWEGKLGAGHSFNPGSNTRSSIARGVACGEGQRSASVTRCHGQQYSRANNSITVFHKQECFSKRAVERALHMGWTTGTSRGSVQDANIAGAAKGV